MQLPLFATLNDLLPYLKDLGIMVLCALILLFSGLVYSIVNRQKKYMLAEFTNNMQRSNRLTPKTTQNHQEMHKLLMELLSQTRAKRVCVFQFHNGSTFLAGNHNWKVSCSQEVLHNGITPSEPFNQNIQVSMVSDFIHPLLADKPEGPGVYPIASCARHAPDCAMAKKGHKVVRYDIHQMNMGDSRRRSIEQGIEHVYAVNLMIPDTRDAFGFLALHFQEMTDADMAYVETCLCAVCEAANRIQYYMTEDYREAMANRSWWNKLWTSD